MAGTKALRTIAEGLLDAKKIGKAIDVTNIDPSKGSGTLGALTNLDEYETVANKLSKEMDRQPLIDEVRLEIQQAFDAEFEKARTEGITEPTASFNLSYQTRTNEEFTNRLSQQLNDPEFAARSILKREETDEVEELRKAIDAGSADDRDINFVNIVDKIASSQGQHRKMVDTIMAPLTRNPRRKAAMDEWMGDSPYAGDLQFHVDRITDPTRSNSFIQFEEPREFGLHSGTNKAAEKVISPSGIEAKMASEAQQIESIKQIAGTLDIPIRELESKFAQAAGRHLRQKFGKEADLNIWDEVDQILKDFVDEIEASPQQLSSFKFELKSLFGPSTTPFLFRGRNGLLLEDTGGFGTGAVADQLEAIFNTSEDIARIDEALGQAGTVAKQRALQKFMENKGYDHIIYHNAVEDKGSMSIINWNPDLMASPWDPVFTRNAAGQAQAAASYLVGALGFTNAVIQSEE